MLKHPELNCPGICKGQICASLRGVFCHLSSDYPGPPGEIQGAGSRVDKDRTLSCSSDTRTVPGILQKVYYMFRLKLLLTPRAASYL